MAEKLVSWNVNGLRACEKKGFSKWFASENAEVVCLQEIKAKPEQLPPEMIHPLNYHSFWHPAEKPGYSGNAIYTRREPLEVRYGIGKKEFDREGRVLTVEFKNFSVISAYFPNSQRDHARLGFKLDFCLAFEKFVKQERARGKSVFMVGDWNIAHTEIDLKNAKANQKNAGFLPEERAWMTKFLGLGYIDGFRHFEKGPGHYTWWSNRPGVREKNVGWRLDYFLLDQESKMRLRAAEHQTNVFGSDHCPIVLKIQS